VPFQHYFPPPHLCNHQTPITSLRTLCSTQYFTIFPHQMVRCPPYTKSRRHKSDDGGLGTVPKPNNIKDEFSSHSGMGYILVVLHNFHAPLCLGTYAYVVSILPVGRNSLTSGGFNNRESYKAARRRGRVDSSQAAGTISRNVSSRQWLVGEVRYLVSVPSTAQELLQIKLPTSR
jgi:hypothetical protein